MKQKLTDRKIWGLIIIGVVLALLAAAIWAGVRHDAQNPPPPCPTTQYGEDIVDFHCVGEDFGNELRAYRAAHPDLEVEAISGDGIGTHGRNNGFWVVFNRTPSAEGYRQGL